MRKSILQRYLQKRFSELTLNDYLFCSWCMKVYNKEGDIEVPGIPYEVGESHGICVQCKAEMSKEVSERKRLKGFDNVS